MKLNRQQLIDLVLESFEAERTNNVARGLEIIHPDFRRTSIYMGSNNIPFPLIIPNQIESEFKKEASVKGRKFTVISASADEEKQIVHIEVIETVPIAGSDKKSVAPYVAVCEIKDGKIWRTRHYGDPELMRLGLSEEEIIKVINT